MCLVTCMIALLVAADYVCQRMMAELTAPVPVFQHAWDRKQAELRYESCRPRPISARVLMLGAGPSVPGGGPAS